jgi:DNA sulfur modification protein DndB
MFHALERGGLFIARTKKGEVVEFGPLWCVDNEGTLKRTITFLIEFFETIRNEARELWERGATEGGGLSMNDGVTVCINVLRSIVQHIQSKQRSHLSDLEDHELAELIKPWGALVGKFFGALTTDQVALFRALRGVQGQTTGTRRVEEALRRAEPTFDPAGLREFLEREKAQTTTRAFEEIQAIEQILQRSILAELKSEFGSEEKDWWFNGVPKSVRKKIDDRINDEGGKKGGREQNFDLIDYREVIVANWQLFESTFGRGKGTKEARTKWVAEVNELRKPVMHASRGTSLPITEEQSTLLQETHAWLTTQLEEQVEEPIESAEMK